MSSTWWELGHADRNSRELVAKVLLACAHEPRTEGLTIDVTDGEGNVENELAAVAEERIDTWTG